MTRGPEPAPPHIEHEKIVLGAVMLDPAGDVVLPELADLLHGADFAHPRHERIWNAALALWTAGAPTDPAAVAAELEHREQLRQAGGASYLHELICLVPTISHAAWHAKKVRDAARARKIAAAGTRLTQLTDTTDPDDVDDAVDLARTLIDQATTDTPHQPDEPAPWPVPDPEVFQGLAGDIALSIDPHTEADPIAVLVTILAAAGALIGRDTYLHAGDTRHPAQIWPLIIGATAGGMKGTSWAAVARILHTITSEFTTDHTLTITRGLSSGEGLIEAVRDHTDTDHGPTPGVADKRLLVIETEFAAVLARAKRDGSTLSTVLRQAWDGENLGLMNRRANALHATDTHIVVIAHITPRELRLKLAEADLVGGLMNRFLPVLSRRSKRLPDGGGTPTNTITDLAARLTRAVETTRNAGRIIRSNDATDYWHHIYETLTPDNLPDGPHAAVIARAVPQVLRLSLTYALTDGHTTVELPHLRAAHHLWRYIDASAHHVFTTPGTHPDLDKLRTAINHAGEQGLSRAAINAEVFSGNRTKTDLDALLDALTTDDRYEQYTRLGKGRPTTRYRRKKRNNERSP